MLVQFLDCSLVVPGSSSWTNIYLLTLLALHMTGKSFFQSSSLSKSKVLADSPAFQIIQPRHLSISHWIFFFEKTTAYVCGNEAANLQVLIDEYRMNIDR